MLTCNSFMSCTSALVSRVWRCPSWHNCLHESYCDLLEELRYRTTPKLVVCILIVLGFLAFFSRYCYNLMTRSRIRTPVALGLKDTSCNLYKGERASPILVATYRSLLNHVKRIRPWRYFTKNAEESQIKELKDQLEQKRKRYERMKEAFFNMDNYSFMFKQLVRYKQSSADVEKQRKAELNQNKVVIERLQRKIRNEEEDRKKNHNEIQDLKGRIRLYCRVRPPLDGRDLKDNESTVDIPTKTKITLLSPEKLAQTRQDHKEYVFHNVFSHKAQQQEVFESVKSLVQSVVDEYNVCALAYGHRDAGKTHTILGSNESPGVARQAIQELFHIRDKQEGNLFFEIHCSIVEMHLNKLRDLLSLKANKTAEVDLKLGSRDLETTTAKPRSLNSKQDFLKVLKEALGRRHTARTRTNDVSSRSHMIISIIVKTTDKQTQQYWIGKLSFVDLAGLERQEPTGSNAAQHQYAGASTKSFQCLHEVIRQVAEGVHNPSYSLSKLTRLLKAYLGGNSKTVMFVNISPYSEDYRETRSSLSYARGTGVIKQDGAKCLMDEEAVLLREQIAKWEAIEDVSGVVEQFL